ncbi:MAG: hypothetical protein ACPGQM_03090, partial [Alphaproteobacteria bacterium]
LAEAGRHTEAVELYAEAVLLDDRPAWRRDYIRALGRLPPHLRDDLLTRQTLLRIKQKVANDPAASSTAVILANTAKEAGRGVLSALRAPPFYLSSFGGSATLWITASLNCHPDVVCFHGTRSVPPYTTDKLSYEVRPQKFVDALVAYANASAGRKVFGAIHGYYGVAAKSALEPYKGYFGAIIRHPTDRFLSLSKIHISRIVGADEDSEILELFRGFESKCSGEENEIQIAAMKKAESLFHDIVKYDVECHEKIQNKNIFRAEDLTKNKTDFKDFVLHITQHKIEVSDAYVEASFKIQDKNRRVQKERGQNKIDAWPPALRAMAREVIDSFGTLRVRSMYESYGYSTDHLYV